jgi:hypothetical protein
MTKPRDPEALLSAYLMEGMEVLPDRVADAVLDEIHRTRQRAVFGPWTARPMFKPSLAVAAVVAVLVAGTLLVTRSDQPEIGNPSPSHPGVAAPSSTPSATPSAESSPTPDAHSLKLTWAKVALDGHAPRVAWLDDRFVLVDQDSGAVATSLDGTSWYALRPGDPDPGYAALLRGSFASWEHDVVGWWNPEDAADGRGDVAGTPPITARDMLRIVRPPAEPIETTPFKGRIQSIGIGPAGIVAQVHSHLDTDAWIASKLGGDWVSRYEEVSFQKGMLEITMKPGRGRGLKVVWADEGFEPGDFMDAGFGWYSPDGEQWTLMPAEAPSPDRDGVRGLLTGFGEVVGVSDGFIARGTAPEEQSCSLPDGCGDMWHSSDGLTWRNLGLGGPEDDSLHVLPWMGGALVTDGVGRFDFWTSQGYRELPMAAKLPAASERPNANSGTGQLGIVTVLNDDKKILVTRDGVDSDIQPMPAEMAAVTGGRLAPTIAVGERSVLIMFWTGSFEEGYVPSLWLGTLEP